jgi:hypothetical protein
VRKEGRLFKGIFFLHAESIRVTSKPRDFILALFIQYKWYTIPRSAKDMTFSALFCDAYEQAADAGFAWEPLLPGGMLDGSWEGLTPFSDIPTPGHLGDFIRLVGLDGLSSEVVLSNAPIHDLQRGIVPATLDAVTDNIPLSDTFVIIEACMSASPANFANASRTVPYIFEHFNKQNLLASEIFEQVWELILSMASSSGPAELTALVGKIQRNSSPAEWSRFHDHIAIKILDTMWNGKMEQFSNESQQDQWNRIAVWVETWEMASSLYADRLLRLAGLIGCGVGLYACEWSRKYFTPMVTKFDCERHVVLVSRAFLEYYHDVNTPLETFIVKVQKQPPAMLAESNPQFRLMMRRPRSRVLSEIGLCLQFSYNTMGKTWLKKYEPLVLSAMDERSRGDIGEPSLSGRWQWDDVLRRH